MPSLRNLPAAYATLRRLWRRRLGQLADDRKGQAPWDATAASATYDPSDPATDKRTAAYRNTVLANCPPFGVALATVRGKSCNRARACTVLLRPPRHAGAVLVGQVGVLPDGDEVIPPGGTRLLACRRSFDKPWAAQTPEAWVAGVNEARKSELELVPRRGVLGWAVVTTLEPGDDRSRVVVRRSTVFALFPEAGVPALVAKKRVE